MWNISTQSQGRVAFESTNQPDLFGLVADAYCCKHTHPAPDDRCRCEFYAIADKTAIEHGGYSGHVWCTHNVILGVALSGTVIAGTKVWRGPRQHARTMEISSTCTRPRCNNRTVGLQPTKLVAITPTGRWMRLHPVCAEHRNAMRTGPWEREDTPSLKAVTLGRLRKLAGVELGFRRSRRDDDPAANLHASERMLGGLQREFVGAATMVLTAQLSTFAIATRGAPLVILLVTAVLAAAGMRGLMAGVRSMRSNRAAVACYMPLVAALVMAAPFIAAAQEGAGLTRLAMTYVLVDLVVMFKLRMLQIISRRFQGNEGMALAAMIFLVGLVLFMFFGIATVGATIASG